MSTCLEVKCPHVYRLSVHVCRGEVSTCVEVKCVHVCRGEVSTCVELKCVHVCRGEVCPRV